MINGSQMRPKPAAEPKLSCRNLWRVFGPNAGYYFDTTGYRVERAALLQRMRAEGHIPAVVDASFDVAPGEIFVMMGLSGSGKSTLLRCLSRLVEPSAGQVLIDGDDLMAASPARLIEIRRHKMGMVFQSFGLLPHLTVLENVAFPLRAQGVSRTRRRARAAEMIALVGLEGRENAFPRELSGGQQQRVGIARSLAVEPDIWFLDEPFSALDPLIRRQMQDEFIRLQRQLHKTIVFVTHDFHEALRIGDRVAIMKDGMIVQIGTPEQLVLDPADSYVAEFTREVPVAKVYRAVSAMEPRSAGDGPHPARPKVLADTTLDAALAHFRGDVEALDVVGDDGRILGILTPRQILRAMNGAAGGEARQ
ncbi:glycine betaine/L-proline ABC transporter ATP-binding protein [Paralimibaculum aggregatum]|uniref:Quaternary amine transport ATP-binding protein n=1 Tax=Paralimibaculum aggregatum TaxID=3036245 RepID=A0ABQ6LIC6_9RHOB|nr:betaine/proline/choline family ABC transporter ATP-binding protein [Limibaculum sp. NKW23]GMG82737.1 glycine betaine/L-proline ABC transporter ATP-binding protein [Limibaculum sp. NKW23]